MYLEYYNHLNLIITRYITYKQALLKFFKLILGIEDVCNSMRHFVTSLAPMSIGMIIWLRNSVIIIVDILFLICLSG